MQRFDLDRVLPENAEILCIGAHSDDIEIGAGGTLTKLLRKRSDLAISWVVCTATVLWKHGRVSAASACNCSSRCAHRRICLQLISITRVSTAGRGHVSCNGWVSRRQLQPLRDISRRRHESSPLSRASLPACLLLSRCSRLSSMPTKLWRRTLAVGIRVWSRE